MLKRLIASLFKLTSGEVERSDGARPDDPAAGQIYSFRTTPYSEFAAAPTGRYAAFKVIGVDAKCVVVAVLDGVWATAPTAKDVRVTSIIEEHRFAHTGRPAIFGVNRGWWQPTDDLEELQFVGTQALSVKERSYADSVVRGEIGTRFSTLHGANYAAEGEWRWSNDRAALVLEAERKKAKEDVERVAKEERYRARLSKLTWDQLLSETPFKRWSPSPPFPPEDFTRTARTVIRDACLAIQKLGPKPRKAEVRAILKKAVRWFNEADERAGGVIETEEREDICAVLEEIAYVARQPALVEEIDMWREW
jgi:hypothetical protein